MDQKMLEELRDSAYNAQVQVGEREDRMWDYDRREEITLGSTPVYSPDLTTMVSAASVLADYNQSNHDSNVRAVLEEMSKGHDFLKVRKIAARGIGLKGIKFWARVLTKGML